MALTLFIIVFIVLLTFGMPIGYVMLISSASYFLASGNALYLLMIPEKMFSGLDIFVLMAIPFFMLSGEIMNRAGMSERIINFSNLIIGRFRGGLAQVNVLSSILFAGLTGVALGDIAALGKIFIPNMEKQGYTRKFAGAVTAASSIVGPIIPPSTIIVLYCAIMELSVGGMFIAAIIPGLLIGISDIIIVAHLAKKHNFPRNKVTVTPRLFFNGMKDATLAALMPFIIIGGILGGVFTPTEAAGTAVVYALFVGFILLRTIKPPVFIKSLKVSVFDTARLFFIIAGAAAVSWVFAIENIDKLVEQIFLNFTTNKVMLTLSIILLFLLMGMWLDPGTIIILFAPILAPMALNVGIHPFQFGILIIIICNIGILTPPIGFVLFAVSKFTGDSIWALSREMLPFLIEDMIVVLIIAFVPNVTLWLPRLFGFI